MIRSFRILVLVALSASPAAGGDPPVIWIQKGASGHVETYAGNGLHASAKVTDPDEDLFSVEAKVFDEETVHYDGPMTAGWFSYHHLHLPALLLPEKLHAFVVTATDAEGNETVEVIGLLPYLPPVVTSVALTPSVPSASDTILVTATLDEEHPTGGRVLGHLQGGLHDEWFEVPMTWDPEAERLEGTIDGLAFGGLLGIEVVGTDSWSSSAPFELAPVPVLPAALALDAVSPAAGALQSGVPVTLQGDGFLHDVDGGTLVVRFGDVEAEVLPSFPSDESIVVVPPAVLVPGSVDVSVTCTKGGEPTSAALAGGYTYLPGPAVVSFDPSGASTALGFEMRILGSGFLDEASGTEAEVRLGGVEAATVEVLGDG
ncbi:MAG: IPT/TIG domain-containing protein, partial [Planctomycetota bacterium JB042]